MRLRHLPPPVPVSFDAAYGDALVARGLPSARPADQRSSNRPLDRDELGEAQPAAPVPRQMLDPAKGWFRTLERHASLFLSHHVFPRIPGMTIPYTVQLDRNLLVSQAEVAVQGLGSGMDGLRVLLISDIHSGPFLSPRSLRRTLRRLRSLNADLILLGGDFASTNVDEFARCAPALDELSAPLGVFGVMGNHDYYTEDPERLWRVVEGRGVTLMRNEATRLERGGSSLILAGLDDYLIGNPDMPATAASIREARNGDETPVLMLSHNPDAFFEAAEEGIDVMLSGHTHGGQVRIPRLPVLVRMSRYRLDQGRYKTGRSELIVTRGLGVSGIPLRVACPPEVLLVKLRAA